jgi:hypothetical protein
MAAGLADADDSHRSWESSWPGRPPAGGEIGVALVARLWLRADDALAVRRRRSSACACELAWESGVGAFAGTPDCCLCARGTASLVNARLLRTAINC